MDGGGWGGEGEVSVSEANSWLFTSGYTAWSGSTATENSSPISNATRNDRMRRATETTHRTMPNQQITASVSNQRVDGRLERREDGRSNGSIGLVCISRQRHQERPPSYLPPVCNAISVPGHSCSAGAVEVRSSSAEPGSARSPRPRTGEQPSRFVQLVTVRGIRDTHP